MTAVQSAGRFSYNLGFTRRPRLFMHIVSRLLALLSVAVHLVLGLFLLGLGVLGVSAGSEMKIDLIPVEPESMALTLIVAGLIAIVAAVLALRPAKAGRLLLVAWSFVVSAVLLAALFRPAYRFDGEEGFWNWALLLLASLVVFLGTVAQARSSGAGRG